MREGPDRQACGYLSTLRAPARGCGDARYVSLCEIAQTLSPGNRAPPASRLAAPSLCPGCHTLTEHSAHSLKPAHDKTMETLLAHAVRALARPGLHVAICSAATSRASRDAVGPRARCRDAGMPRGRGVGSCRGPTPPGNDVRARPGPGVLQRLHLFTDRQPLARAVRADHGSAGQGSRSRGVFER